MNRLNFSNRWESGRLATILAENTEKNTLLSSTDALQFRYGEIRPKPTYRLTDDLIDTYRKYAIVRPNDIMLNGLNLNYDFVTQRVAQVKTDGIITSAYISLRPRERVSAQYYTYLLKSLDAMKVFNGMGTGIRLTLSYNLLKNLELPIPLRAEQDQIVRYLDWQVSKINKLIAAKKRQIALLKEHERKLIASAVSNSNDISFTQVRTSHANELLPSDWRMVSLGRLLTRIEQGWSPNAGEELGVSDQWYVLTLSAIKHGKYQRDAKKPIDISAKIPLNLQVRDGDILITRSNTRTLVGDVCIAENVAPNTIFSDLIYRLSINGLIAVPRYILYYLLSAFSRYQIECAAKGSSGTMPKLAHSDIKQIRVLLPPISKQRIVCAKLDQHARSTNENIVKILTGIDMLVELRTRLISDVVTGQIDVRKIEVPDFEMVEETTADESSDEDDISEEAEEQEE